MRARYKLTEFLANTITNIRENRLGYCYDEFGELLGIGGSSCYYMVKRIRRNYISPDLLIRLFAIEYNCLLFIEKFDKMTELLNKAINDGFIKPNTTLRDMYGTKDAIRADVNPTLTKPPISIFEKQECVINTNFRTKKYAPSIDIFNESLFSEEQRYIPLINYDDKQKERLDKYIEKRVQELLNTCNTVQKTTEYWLYAMYFMYKEISITDTCLLYINKCYFNSSDLHVCNWSVVWNKLGENKNLKNCNQYDDEDIIYFRDKKEDNMSRYNLPVFYKKYKSLPKCEEQTENYYHLERSNAVKCKFKLVDIFMIIFQYQLNTLKNEDYAFRETCFELYSNGIFTPFDALRIIDLPDETGLNGTKESTKLIFELFKFFNGTNIEPTDYVMQKFENNIRNYNFKFLSTIAVDFSIISELNHHNCIKLRNEINNTVQKFKENVK